MNDRNNEPPEWERLNREAMLALGLARPSIIAPIVALLRSGAPIDDAVRNALADAFEGLRPGGAPQFVVKGTGRGAHVGLSLANFRRDVMIARYITKRRGEGATLQDAADDAAAQFRQSDETCKRAVKETRKMDAYYLRLLGREFVDKTIEDPRSGASAVAGYWATFVWKGGAAVCG